MKPFAGQMLSNRSGGAWQVVRVRASDTDPEQFSVELIARHHLEAGRHELRFMLSKQQFEEFCRIEEISP